MAEIITKAFLINSIDFEIFDEIITFLNEHGNFFTCIAKGVKKIKSKNSRHLRMGVFSEFIFFQSRMPNTIGKLKKVVSLENVDFSFSINPALLFVNNMYYKFKINSSQTYNTYLESLEFIKNDTIHELSILKSIFIFLKITGIKLNLDSCIECGAKKINNFSIDKLSFICFDCNEENIKFSLNTIKIFHFLNLKKYDELVKYKKLDLIIAIKILLSIIKNNLGVDLYKSLLY